MSSKPEETFTEASFLDNLYQFMKSRGSPIERIPHLGFKQIDLFLLYSIVKSLGGFHQVTGKQQWKKVYNLLGGDPRSTSAATCTRRHYEKLILPFECHLKGEKTNLIPPRQLKRIRPYPFPKRSDPTLQGSKKRAMCDKMQPLHFQVSHSHHYQPRPPTQPLYVPIPSSMLPSLTQHPDLYSHLQAYPQAQTESSEEIVRPKHQLAMLRALAQEYTSSAGWEEPLNLSCKSESLDSISQTPSSFRPLSSAKKFINTVSMNHVGEKMSSKGFDMNSQIQLNPTNLATGSPRVIAPDSMSLTRFTFSSPTMRNHSSGAPDILDLHSCISKVPKASPGEVEEPINLKKSSGPAEGAACPQKSNAPVRPPPSTAFNSYNLQKNHLQSQTKMNSSDTWMAVEDLTVAAVPGNQRVLPPGEMIAKECGFWKKSLEPVESCVGSSVCSIQDLESLSERYFNTLAMKYHFPRAASESSADERAFSFSSEYEALKLLYIRWLQAHKFSVPSCF